FPKRFLQLVLAPDPAPADDARDQTLPLALRKLPKLLHPGENNPPGFRPREARQATDDAAQGALVNSLLGLRRGVRAGGSTGRLDRVAPRNGRIAARQAMSKGDLLVERGAEGLEKLSRKAAANGGFSASIAAALAEDAAFLRKLKPSLIKARAQGKAPTEGKSPVNRAPQEPRASSGPPISASRPRKRRRPKRRRQRAGGPNPF